MPRQAEDKACCNTPLSERLARLVTIISDGLMQVLRRCSIRRIWTSCTLLLFFSSIVVWRETSSPRNHRHRRLESASAGASKVNQQTNKKPKILYIITSIHEFDNGLRETVSGYDRFSNTLIPVVRESTQSMIAAGYQLDVYLITQYVVSEERLDQLQDLLNPLGSVSLQVWDDATPLGYAPDTNSTYLQPITRALARQHRLVIKDNLLDYDFFIAMEDDMIVKGEHVQHYMKLTQDLYEMRQAAPDKLFRNKTVQDMQSVFYGPMSKLQLQRLVPGFIRVEASLQHYHPHLRNRQPQIPMDYTWPNDDAATTSHNQVNASICCHVSTKSSSNEHLPLAPPTAEELFFWETSIVALGVRQLPNQAWALLLGGNSDQYYVDPNFVLGDYWSGRDGYYGSKQQPRPDKTLSLYMSNQGGWMATRRQVLEWHRRWCRGGFLPPFDKPQYVSDGLESKTVEFWSGGIQLAGVLGCNLQRIVLLDPADDAFSKHLLYHSSNNKQKVKNVQYRFSSRSVQQFWGQLNTIRKNAERARDKELLELRTT
jgi:hypothetical protein